MANISSLTVIGAAGLFLLSTFSCDAFLPSSFSSASRDASAAKRSNMHNHATRAFPSSTAVTNIFTNPNFDASAIGNNRNKHSRSPTFSLRAGADPLSSSESEPTSKIDPKDNINNDEEDLPPFDFEKFTSQLKSFREMAFPYYQESKSGRWLFAGMLALCLMNSGVSVLFSYVGRDFWSALSSKEAEQFNAMLIKFSGALVVGAPVSVLFRFQREKLAIEWREWMTDRTLQLYSSNRVYYALERGSEIDNPDQRIAEDVRSFTAFSLTFFITLVTSVIDLVSFSVILYSIQPQLFGAIIAYSAFGTICTTSLGKRLIGLNFLRLQTEADFRYSLVRVRDNAESIAFYGGEDIESEEISNRLTKVVENKKDLIKSQRNLEYFTTAYQYLIQVLPVSVVAPQFFAGKIQLGVVSQSNGAFNHILNDLSVIVNQFESLSTFSAGIDRLSQFMKAIREADSERANDSPLMKLPLNATELKLQQEEQELAAADAMTSLNAASIGAELTTHSTINLHQMPSFTTTHEQSHILSLNDLVLNTPDRKRTLIQNLTLSLKPKQNLLIVGNSGAGKSSLLRAIAGLWTSGSGSITRPSDEDVYFLPQRPYCALGSLKDQLLYPSRSEQIDPEKYPAGHRLSQAHILRQSLSDEDFLDILKQVDLEDLPLRSGDGDAIAGLNTVKDWSNILSLGEQQRLAFGRLLVNKPHLVILDEATSALDMEAEKIMYGLLQDKKDDLTYISVGHRPSLLNYHDMRLRLNGNDDYSLESIDVSKLEDLPSIVVENM